MLKSPNTAKQDELNTRELLLNVNKRMQRIAMLTSVTTIVLGLAIFAMAPLKKTIPYVVQVDKISGEVVAPVQEVAEQYRPDWASKSFFVRRWISDLLTINNYTLATINDPRAQYFLRGRTAIAEFNNFRAQDNTYGKIAKDPAMVRTVKIQNFTPVAGVKNAAVANVVTTTIKDGETTTKNRLVTVYWTIFPLSALSPADLKKDPIGIYITDFKISNS